MEQDNSVRSSEELLTEYSQTINLLCRLCGLYHKEFQNITDDEGLLKKIHFCLPIIIEINEMLPHNICDSCVQHVSETYAFFNLCLKTDKKFKNLLRTLKHEKDGTTPSSLSNLGAQQIHKNLVQDLNLIDQIDVIKQNGISTDVPNITTDTREQKSNLRGLDEIREDRQFVLIPTQQQNSVTCDKCHTGFVNNSDLKQHIIKECKFRTTYQCSDCKKTFKSYKALSLHQSIHVEVKQYLCDVCGKSFGHRTKLQHHQRTHSDKIKKFVCQICSKSFFSSCSLKDHLNVHNGSTPYKCQVCLKEFRESVHLRQHRWTHLNKKFTCLLCGSQFNRRGNLTTHSKKHAKELTCDIVKDRPTTLKVQSPVISKNETIKRVEKKTKLKQKNIYCEICGKSFYHAGSMTYHRRKEHTGERPYKCNYCNETFILKSVCLIHERKEHTRVLPYQCVTCNKSFTSSSSYNNHLYVHKTEKCYKCDICGNKFTRKSALTVHNKIHLGLKEHVCEECGKSFVQKNDLLKHKKVHKSHPKTLYCKYCGDSFSERKSIIEHVNCKINLLNKNKNSFDEKCKQYLFDRITDDENVIAQSVKLFVHDNKSNECLNIFDDYNQKTDEQNVLLDKPIVLTWPYS